MKLFSLITHFCSDVDKRSNMKRAKCAMARTSGFITLVTRHVVSGPTSLLKRGLYKSKKVYWNYFPSKFEMDAVNNLTFYTF